MPMPKAREDRDTQRSRFLYLQCKAIDVPALGAMLMEIAPVRAQGLAPVADPSGCWFELTFARARSIPELRALLSTRRFADHVVRIDLMEHPGDGRIYAQQKPLFAEALS